MSLITLQLPTPKQMRGGWAALAAVLASRGWGYGVFATENQWQYQDGGGNWATLRLLDSGRAVLVGHDHEYSETYFGEAVQYFKEEETDLLAGAPHWWAVDLDPQPCGEWIGFIYGWDGKNWSRAAYEKFDGFESVGLLKACSLENIDLLTQYAAAAPGLGGERPSAEAIRALVAADADITHEMLEAVIPGWNIEAGVEAARDFLKVDLR